MARKKKSFMTPKASRRKARKRLSTTSARVKKEFTYRGFNLEQLEAMPLWPDESSEDYIVGLLPSRARRSMGRGMSVENEHFLARMNRSGARTMRTHRRDMPILPQFVGRRIAIYNGQHFVEIAVKPMRCDFESIGDRPWFIGTPNTVFKPFKNCHTLARRSIVKSYL